MERFIRRAYKVDDDAKFPAPLPLNLTRDQLARVVGTESDSFEQFVASPKLDGERFLLVCHAGAIRAVGRDEVLREVALPTFPPNTIFDCERLNEYFFVFDAPVVNGISLTEKPYHHRLQIAGEWIRRLGEPLELKFPDSIVGSIGVSCGDHKMVLKPIYHNAPEEFPFETDGVIFTSVVAPIEPYRADAIFKWKTPEQHTIDFRVIGRTLYVRDGSQDIPFGILDGEPREDIWECSLGSARTWIAVRPRPEKSRPNSLFVATSTLQSIRENITRDELVRRVV